MKKIALSLLLLFTFSCNSNVDTKPDNKEEAKKEVKEEPKNEKTPEKEEKHIFCTKSNVCHWLNQLRNF